MPSFISCFVPTFAYVSPRYQHLVPEVVILATAEQPYLKDLLSKSPEYQKLDWVFLH